MVYLNGTPIEEKFFPDGTLNMMHLPREVLEESDGCFVVSWFFENLTEQIMVYNLVHHLRDVTYTKEVSLILPYIPNARMDRVHDSTIEVNTLKYFAAFINDLHFDVVIVLDPHSDVSVALLNSLVIPSQESLLTPVLQTVKPDYLFFPDAGAAKRYGDMFDIPFLYGEKTRDWQSGRIVGLEVRNPLQIPKHEIEGSKVLIIDDICSYGGTFMRAGNALKELGVHQVDLWVTHCENSIFAGLLLKEDSPIANIYTTDSLHRAEHDKIHTMVLDKGGLK